MEDMIITGYQWIERQIQRDFPDLTTGYYLLVIALYDAYFYEEQRICTFIEYNKVEKDLIWEYEWWCGEECSLIGLLPTRSLIPSEVEDLTNFKFREN